MVTIYYFIAFLAAFAMTVIFFIRNKKINSEFALFAVAVTINCMGRWLLAKADTMDMAILANDILYLGGCTVPLMTVFVLASLCGIKIPKGLKAVMVAYSAIVMGLVLTIGKYPIYYKSIEIIHGNGFNYIRKEYGPLHILYPVMMTLYSLLMIGCMLYGIRKRKQISYRTVATIAIAGSAMVTMYLIERIAKLNVSLLPASYVVAILFLTKYFDRISMYDMTTNVVNSVEKMKEYGYIVFDDKFRYMNSNSYIKELFPEINTWTVDKEVPESDSYIYMEVVKYLKSWNEKSDTKKILMANDHYFQLDIRRLTHGRKKNIGYIIEFIDRTAEHKYYHAIENYNETLKEEVEEKTADIMHIKDMLVLGMADMVESRDNNTGGHIKRTSAVVKIFAEKLMNEGCSYDLNSHFLQEVEKAAPMHDLGKIAIDDKVLRKPGKYTDEEYNEMKRHPVEGARIVENILRGVEEDEFVEIARNVAYYHHEKWNGQGYPCGIKGEKIPVEARIMALADVFDALVSKRCYKEAFTYDKAFNIISESLGEHFDPELGKIFITCRPELEALYNSFA